MTVFMDIGTLSIVVPAYNVDEYVRECVESLIAQPVVCEVIVVDDGSTDKTPDVLAQLAAEHPRQLRVFECDHRGLSESRNYGAARAQGEYLAFCDADDRVPAAGYAPLLESLRETGSDFASGDVRRFDSTRMWPHPRYRDVFSQSRARTHLSRDALLLLDRMSWNKVFRRSFWDAMALRFWLPAYEDAPVMIRAHASASSVDVVSQVVYHWRVRDGSTKSITQRLHEPANVADRMTMAIETQAVIHELVPHLQGPFALDIVRGDMRVLQDAARMNEPDTMDDAVRLARRFLHMSPDLDVSSLSASELERLEAIESLDLEALHHSMDAEVWDPAGRRR